MKTADDFNECLTKFMLVSELCALAEGCLPDGQEIDLDLRATRTLVTTARMINDQAIQALPDALGKSWQPFALSKPSGSATSTKPKAIGASQT